MQAWIQMSTILFKDARRKMQPVQDAKDSRFKKTGAIHRATEMYS